MMAKKKKHTERLKIGEERKFISKEELQNMRFKLSIEIPKEDFDELVKAMMGMDGENQDSDINTAILPDKS